MEEERGYDVLRLIEHSRKCYISAEYVRGRPLVYWLKYHPVLPKEQLFSWIHEITRQLDRIHRCKGAPCYKYVNPYSIVVTDEKELYFLDMNAKSNRKMLPVMERRSVREHFLPPENVYYQEERMDFDIYGLGRTIQYLLAISEPEPSLTRKEVKRFQRIISKCLAGEAKKGYKQASELQRQIPFCRRSEGLDMKKGLIKRALVIGVIFAVLTAFVVLTLSLPQLSADRRNSRDERETENISENASENISAVRQEVSELNRELGFLSFLVQKDYIESRKYFGKVEGDETARKLAELSEYMASGNIYGKEGGLYALLVTIEKGAEKENEQLYRCLLEGYRLLDTPEAARAVLRLAGQCMEAADSGTKRELVSYMAPAYEKTGEIQKAAEAYTDMLTWETKKEMREELYKKIVLLRKEQGEADKASEICRQGIEELQDSKELRLAHIHMQCASPEIEREVCAQTIKKYIEEIPEIVEELEFQKLTKEYDIVVEGEQVWVGR